MNNFREQYEKALYFVNGLDTPIKINSINSEIESLLEERKFETWAYLTAFNPQSIILPIEENLRRNKELYWEIRAYYILKGKGCDPKGEWLPEDSYFILGINLKEARQLALKYNQSAFVYGEKGNPAQLIFSA